MAFCAKLVLLFAASFCLSVTPGKSQLPAWLGLLGNLNGTAMTSLLKQLNANSTLPDLLNQLNSTDGQKLLQGIVKAFGGMDLASLFGSQIMNSLRQMPLGACGRDLERISQNKEETIAYIDAAGKPPSSITRGNLYWPVSVEQCREISNSHICGSAMGLWIPSVELFIKTFTWTGCFPSSCNKQNVSTIMTTVTSQVALLTNKGLTLIHYGSYCVPGGPSYDTGAICTLVLCALLLLLCLIGTILDMIIETLDDISKQTTSSSGQTNNIELQPEIPFEGHLTQNGAAEVTKEPQAAAKITSEPPRFLKWTVCEVFLCFSLIRNTKKIFNTDVPASAITSINGIRVISIWWVVLGHVFLYFVVSPVVENKVQYGKDAKELSVMPVINGYYAVDSFFFLSGLLVAYTCLRKIAKNDGKFNWVLFYVHRFWRLTPSYMFVILFTVHVKGLISDSPYWHAYYKDRFCPDKWWTNLLYINNFYPEEFNEQCIGWTWYLANDMQFFVISPILLILAYKKGWRGLLFSSGTLLGISSIVIAALIGHYDLDPVVNLKSVVRGTEELRKEAAKFDKYVYNKPYCRIQPYLVGFILGYAIYTKYRVPIRRRVWLLAVVGWSIAFAIAMTVVYAPYESTLPDNREWNKTENIFYGTFQRLLWGLVLAWVTYACHYGYGSYIQQFLSARFWIPLSRLTYSVYLIHLVVIEFMFFARNDQVYYNILAASYYFIVATVLSYAVGFILAVVIEFPSENLENLALKLWRGERKKYGVNT